MTAADPTPRPPRRWRDKFRDAFRGVWLGTRGQSSFAVHAFAAVAVVSAAAVLRCDPAEWGLLVLCVGLVLTAELFNTSIETLFRGLTRDARDRVYPALDIAAGAVLAAAGTAAVVGAVVLGRRLLLCANLL